MTQAKTKYYIIMIRKTTREQLWPSPITNDNQIVSLKPYIVTLWIDGVLKNELYGASKAND